MTEFDPELVEKGAAAIKAVINDGQSRRHRNVHEEFSRAVLSAVAPNLRADAWDEGFNAGLNEDVRVENGYEPSTNPYRVEGDE